mmetsp:Transcript_27098/g.43407  ORF Transcript_27098/g.43407 Transcript_27098/m.43407 type:complete len:224 (-) Transcript_27098:1422-2093(-)
MGEAQKRLVALRLSVEVPTSFPQLAPLFASPMGDRGQEAAVLCLCVCEQVSLRTSRASCRPAAACWKRHGFLNPSRSGLSLAEEIRLRRMRLMMARVTGVFFLRLPGSLPLLRHLLPRRLPPDRKDEDHRQQCVALAEPTESKVLSSMFQSRSMPSPSVTPRRAALSHLRKGIGQCSVLEGRDPRLPVSAQGSRLTSRLCEVAEMWREEGAHQDELIRIRPPT